MTDVLDPRLPPPTLECALEPGRIVSRSRCHRIEESTSEMAAIVSLGTAGWTPPGTVVLAIQIASGSLKGWGRGRIDLTADAARALADKIRSAADRAEAEAAGGAPQG